MFDINGGSPDEPVSDWGDLRPDLKTSHITIIIWFRTSVLSDVQTRFLLIVRVNYGINRPKTPVVGAQFKAS